MEYPSCSKSYLSEEAILQSTAMFSSLSIHSKSAKEEQQTEEEQQAEHEQQAEKDYSRDSEMDKEKLDLYKAIIYGSIAECLPEKLADGRTHKWTIYLKPYLNEDMEAYVKKVHFKLHDSYTKANRTIMQMPYEVSETGWGEFEIIIKLYFQDPQERPITIHHMLQLHHRVPNDEKEAMKDSPVVSEHYDEIVFNEPTLLMRKCLTGDLKPYTNGEWKHHTDYEKVKKETVEKILAAREKVGRELEETKMKFLLAQETLANYKEKYANNKRSAPEMFLTGIQQTGCKRGRFSYRRYSK